MKFCKLTRQTILVLTLTLVIISSVTFTACKKAPRTLDISTLYTGLVSDLNWVTKSSDLVIVADFTKADKAKKGVENTQSKDEVVYTDNHVKVVQVIKNTTNNNIKIGDDVIVRLIGGTAGDLSMSINGEKATFNQGEMVLFLTVSERNRMLPKTPNKTCYSTMGGVNGAFYVSSDGIAKCSHMDDSYKLEDLVKIVESQGN